MLRKKLVALLAVAVVAVGVVGCGGGGEQPASTSDNNQSDAPADDAADAPADDAADTPADDAADTPADDATDEPADDAGSEGGTIKVGVINNDPNESGYRTANDADLQRVFCAENGYDASFAYSNKNDEQITAAQQFIQNGVDYLLLSAADTSGWDGVLQDAQAQGVKVILFDRVIDADESFYEASIVSDMDAEGERAVEWLANQGLDEYKIIHLQGVMGAAAQRGRTGALDAKVQEDDKWTLVAQQTAEWNAEKAQQIVQSVIAAGDDFNVIYAENDDMAKGAVAALDAANIKHGAGEKVIIMGFDFNRWALEEVKKGTWNYDGQCNPYQADEIDKVIKTLESGGTVEQKQIIMEEKGVDHETITDEDIENFGI
ncbi:substrate-binding domain-containing protein [Lachnospiraceae bacterium 29-84]